jgi:hypothetical protein
MTPDELSELAECLEDACREAELRGWIVGPPIVGNPTPCCCPFGALIAGRGPRVPTPGQVLMCGVAIHYDSISAFMHGFDGLSCLVLSGEYALGRLFREQYVRC